MYSALAAEGGFLLPTRIFPQPVKSSPIQDNLIRQPDWQLLRPRTVNPGAREPRLSTVRIPWKPAPAHGAKQRCLRWEIKRGGSMNA